jgi:filamentous hemagglutinin family protein
LETLGLVVRGLTHQQIADQMRISSRTVQLHADSIRSKLNANSISEAVYLANKAGLITGKVMTNQASTELRSNDGPHH